MTIEFIKLLELAQEEHVPRGMFSGGDVVLFRATQNTGIAGDQPARELFVDPLLGWQQRVQTPVIAVDVPGGHSSALQMPFVTTLSKEMQACINAALARHQESSAETTTYRRQSGT